MLTRYSLNPSPTRRPGSRTRKSSLPASRALALATPTSRLSASLAATVLLLLLSLSVLVLASGCASSNGAPGVVPGRPLASDPDLIREYSALMQVDIALVRRGEPMLTPKMRAWIREADRTIRANNAVYGLQPDGREDHGALARGWLAFRDWAFGEPR